MGNPSLTLRVVSHPVQNFLIVLRQSFRRVSRVEGLFNTAARGGTHPIALTRRAEQFANHIRQCLWRIDWHQARAFYSGENLSRSADVRCDDRRGSGCSLEQNSTKRFLSRRVY